MRVDTLSCPEFEEEVLRAVCARYKFKPTNKPADRRIKPALFIFAEEQSRSETEHAASVARLADTVLPNDIPPVDIPDVPREDFRAVCALLALVKTTGRGKGNRKAKK